MIFSTLEIKTSAYIWNTRQEIELDKYTRLSDYTELSEEFDDKTLRETFTKLCSENEGLRMKSPALMMITSGDSKSCRVWIDRSLLEEQPGVADPKQGFEYYSCC